MPVGIIRDEDLCNLIHVNHRTNPIVFWRVDEQNLEKNSPDSTAEVHAIIGSDTKEVVEKVLALLPNLQILDDNSFGVSDTYF